MGWLWIATPVAFLALVGLWDRRARRRHRLRGGAGVDLVMGRAPEGSQESSELRVNQQPNVWNIGNWFGGGP